jgi:hypothetical protein
MKSMKVLMMTVAASILAAPCVMANDVVLKAQVPFDFVVADRHLPSGEYSFVQDQESRVVRILSEEREQVAVAHWQPLVPGVKGSGKLVFHKHGGQRFLRMIRATDGGGAYLPESGSEKAEAAAQAERNSVTVAGLQ